MGDSQDPSRQTFFILVSLFQLVLPYSSPQNCWKDQYTDDHFTSHPKSEMKVEECFKKICPCNYCYDPHFTAYKIYSNSLPWHVSTAYFSHTHSSNCMQANSRQKAFMLLCFCRSWPLHLSSSPGIAWGKEPSLYFLAWNWRPLSVSHVCPSATLPKTGFTRHNWRKTIFDTCQCPNRQIRTHIKITVTAGFVRASPF